MNFEFKSELETVLDLHKVEKVLNIKKKLNLKNGIMPHGEIALKKIFKNSTRGEENIVKRD